MIVHQPLKVVGLDGRMDVTVTVKGGGTTGQAGRHTSTESPVRCLPTTRNCVPS